MFRFNGEPDAQVAVKPVVIDHAFGVAVVVLQVDILVADFRQPESGVHLEIRIQIPAAPFNDEHRKAKPLVTGLVGSGDLSVAGVADDVRIVRQRERDPEFGPDAVRQFAAREALPLIDLTAASAQLVQQLGEPASRELYMVFAPGLYPNYPDGKTDNTHLRNPGAVAFAGLVAKGLQTLGGSYANVLLGTPEPDKYDGRGYEK